ncbi:MAG: glycoside hydrolase family 15 [Alicyclobacillus herbarius]|uniref:glycoside hydrolase family 15 protein n=1 Tax=Alicyclobacillus herbarius TaxID=122960 RepID=UPI00235768C5|nr:glycoside hydrolase family 15 protein [Alicyclobacillus herbarius]MCL6631328.1 glycoside hydrolase family 15 [Alicyclobacillus herbarius]
MRSTAHAVLETMRLPNGLYVASRSPDYRYVWIRDVCYIVLAYLDAADDNRFEQAYHKMLDIFHHYSWKLDYHAEHRPHEVYEYIHPRYHADTLEELTEPWGNAQNDAIGAFLFGIGLGLQHGKRMLRDERDEYLIQQFIRYLTTLRYWQDADNGIWEEHREVHASSIGACTAGLLALMPFFSINWSVVQQGMSALFNILPRESASKESDLAQLSLVYPYRLLPPSMARLLIEQVERQLLRERGVIRYLGDCYYERDGREAEWCLGIPWLGLCWLTVDERDKAAAYLRWTEQIMPEPGVLPESYYGGTAQANPNTPLAWAVSMYIQLLDQMETSYSYTAAVSNDRPNRPTT